RSGPRLASPACGRPLCHRLVAGAGAISNKPSAFIAASKPERLEGLVPLDDFRQPRDRLGLCGTNNVAILPPPAYDKPFPGELIVNIAKEMTTWLIYAAPALGCAIRYMYSVSGERCRRRGDKSLTLTCNE